MKPAFPLVCCSFFLWASLLNAQIPPGVYITNVENVRHEIKISDNYFVYSSYKTTPPEFINTLGGFAQVENSAGKDMLLILLEFNSDYQRDSVTQLTIPMKMDGKNLHLDWFDNLKLTPLENTAQDLDGTWLFATRGPDEGQERRGEANTRKTLKYLQDGRFQWMAYDTDGFKFSGTGGGSYTSKNGIYTERIDYFSRDNSRAGAALEFKYEIKGDDWHHTGNNSKGEPLYEIWSRRPAAE